MRSVDDLKFSKFLDVQLEAKSPFCFKFLLND